MYGPVRTVVWEGSGRKARPYPDPVVERGPASDTTGPPQSESSTPKVWQNHYLNQPPHNSLNYRRPKAFIAALVTPIRVTAAREANTKNRADGE